MRTTPASPRSRIAHHLALCLFVGACACDNQDQVAERHEQAAIEMAAREFVRAENEAIKAQAEHDADEIVEAMAAAQKLAAAPTTPRSQADPAEPEIVPKTPLKTAQPDKQRYRPRLLDEAPATSQIPAGDYLCRIAKEYKLRPCTVRIDDRGHTRLSVPEALIAIEGVLYDDGSTVRFDGWPTESRPFGCFSCSPECAQNPSSCGCRELDAAGSAHCLAQPITFDLERRGKGWRGKMSYNLYYNRYEGTPPKRRVTGYEFENQSFVVQIQPAKAPPK